MAENNMRIYEAVKKVPDEAKKVIVGGTLKGFTEITPMWRIKKLTEQFGPAGIGWYYNIVERWFTPGTNEEVNAFVYLQLFVKENGEWSKGIEAIGQSSFVSNFSTGKKTNDDVYKKATTDALSYACKMLGIGADVYWENDRESYEEEETSSASKKSSTKTSTKAANKCSKDASSSNNDELPNPTKKNNNLATLRAIVVPEDVKDYAGKTLGSIADTSLNELKAVAYATKDKTLQNSIVELYNQIVSSEKAA